MLQNDKKRSKSDHCFIAVFMKNIMLLDQLSSVINRY